MARSTGGESPRDIVSRRVSETAQNLIGKLRGRGRKRKANKAVKRKKITAPKKEDYKKRYLLLSDIILYWTAVAAAAAAAMSVSLSSEFDIFAPKPVQASVIETTEVCYKPIASVDQSDLEFLIPSNSDTFIDLNIRLYIRGQLIKMTAQLWTTPISRR